jgi:hypothetical protein
VVNETIAEAVSPHMPRLVFCEPSPMRQIVLHGDQSVGVAVIA